MDRRRARAPSYGLEEARRATKKTGLAQIEVATSGDFQFNGGIRTRVVPNRLDIKVSRMQGIRLDKCTTGLNIIPHEGGEDFISGNCVLDLDSQ